MSRLIGFFLSDIETVPVTPSPRTLALEVVNLVSDTDAIQMEVCDAGRIYYLRICLDRGSSLVGKILF